MLEGNLKDRNIKLYLGMPMYGGMLSESTFHSVMGLQAWCGENGVKLKVQTMGNESLITRARNTVVSMFLDDKDFIGTHLLFIDADIGFTNKNIERLIRVDEDIACGIYPRKCIHWSQVKDTLKQDPDASEALLEARSLGYNLNFANNRDIKLNNGFAEVMEAATGMMLIKRDVFNVMKKKFPERKYKSDQIINGKRYSSDNCYDLFSVGKLTEDPNERYLSEDYFFSRLWQHCGGKIWADVTQPLTHFGNMGFKGHVGTMFKMKNAENDKTTTRDTETNQ